MQLDMFQTEALINNLNELSFEQCKNVIKHRKEHCYKPSFKQFAEDRGVNIDTLQHHILNGMCNKLFAPCMRGSKSDYKHVKPGQKAEAELAALKNAYSEAIEAGVVIKKTFNVSLNFERDQDIAHLRIRIRRCCLKEIRNSKKQKRPYVIHPDHSWVLQN